MKRSNQVKYSTEIHFYCGWVRIAIKSSRLLTSSTSVILVSVGEAIILLTVIFLRTRILIAIALIQESSKSVTSESTSSIQAKFGCLGLVQFLETRCQCWSTNVRLCVCVGIPQGDRSHDVSSAVPVGHLRSPGGVCHLLGRHCSVSFPGMYIFNMHNPVCHTQVCSWFLRWIRIKHHWYLRHKSGPKTSSRLYLCQNGS